MRRLFADVDNGDLMRLIPLGEEDEQERRYIYAGGYVTMGLLNITRLVQADLPADAYRLALVIAARAVPVTGLVYCLNAEYAEELGISRKYISRLIGILGKANFIYRLGPRTIMVNPGWCFRGTPEQQDIALEAWAKFHPLGIVRRGDRRIA